MMHKKCYFPTLASKDERTELKQKLDALNTELQHYLNTRFQTDLGNFKGSQTSIKTDDDINSNTDQSIWKRIWNFFKGLFKKPNRTTQIIPIDAENAKTIILKAQLFRELKGKLAEMNMNKNNEQSNAQNEEHYETCVDAQIDCFDAIVDKDDRSLRIRLSSYDKMKSNSKTILKLDHDSRIIFEDDYESSSNTDGETKDTKKESIAKMHEMNYKMGMLNSIIPGNSKKKLDYPKYEISYDLATDESISMRKERAERIKYEQNNNQNLRKQKLLDQFPTKIQAAKLKPINPQIIRRNYFTDAEDDEDDKDDDRY